MKSDMLILDELRVAFPGRPRPQRFFLDLTNPDARDHDALLQTRDTETLQANDLGTPGWDPLCAISPAGLAYYFPAVARMALEADGKATEWYPYRLLFHLTYEGVKNRFLCNFDVLQKQAILKFLRYLLASRIDIITEYEYTEKFYEAIDLWSSHLSSADGQTA